MDTPSSLANRRARGDRIKLNRHLMLRLAEALGSRLPSDGEPSRSQHEAAATADFMIAGSGLEEEEEETCTKEKGEATKTTIKERTKTCLLPIVLFVDDEQGHRVAFESTKTTTTTTTTTRRRQRDDCKEPIILRTSSEQEIEEEEREKVRDYSHCSIGLDGLDGLIHLRPNSDNNCHLSVQFCSLSTSTSTTSDEIELYLSSLFLLSHCYANDKYKLYNNNNNNNNEDVKSYVTAAAARLCQDDDDCCCWRSDAPNCNARQEEGNFLVVTCRRHRRRRRRAASRPNGQVASRLQHFREQHEEESRQLEAEYQQQDDRFFDRQRTHEPTEQREQMGAASWRRPKKQRIGRRRRTINKKGKSVIDDNDDEEEEEEEEGEEKEEQRTTAIAHCDIQAALNYTNYKTTTRSGNTSSKTNGGRFLNSFFSLLLFLLFITLNATTTTRNSVPNLLLVSAANSSAANLTADMMMMTQTTRAMQEELSRAVMATMMTSTTSTTTTTSTTSTTQAVPTTVNRLRSANETGLDGSTLVPTASPLMLTDYDDDDTLQQLSSSSSSSSSSSPRTTTSLPTTSGNLTLSPASRQQTSGLEDYFDRTVDFARIFAMVAIMIGDICGNSLVILSVVRHSKLRVTTNWFVVSLACADILVALFAMTFNASVQITGRWIFPRWMCDFWNSCDVLASTASILHLCCISIDRYYAIMRPLDYPMKITTRRVCYALAVVWISSALLSYIPIFTGIYTTSEHILWQAENPDQCEFVVNRVYAIVSSSISFWIPCCIMVFTYYKIYQEATRQEKFIYKAQNMLPAPQVNHHHHHSNSHHNQRAKQRRSKSMAITSLTSSSSSSSKGNVKSAAANKRTAAQQLASKQQEQQQQQQQQLAAIAASSDALDHSDATATGPVAPGEQQPLTGSAIDINNNSSTNGAAGERPKIVTTTTTTTATSKDQDQDERDSNSGQSTPTKRSISKMKREHKAAKTLGIIMGVFILCWLPFFSWYTPQHICGKACDGIIPGAVVTLLFWIGYFNSTLNPIIYAYFNHEFRDAFKKTLQWIFCCCRDLKCLRVSRPNDNQHYNCTYRSTQEIGLVTNS